ncbi:hypothetical protein [Hyphomicrobium sp. MC1]|uniref:hypothetical protein n=1 Tax=Hyphomicrobium sp. (strain MC1) TaxID=717785 RepID=UPI000213E45C|nr:hypothetical protein [Hyphomicrobium sp. MC1]CCB66514.1 protein of unknown function [Hyphomicrobium sp. MC1]
MAENTASAATPSGMRSEIANKWSKISAQEVSALKTKDDLVAQVQSKYQLDKTQAAKDVEAFANGRQL